MMVSMWKSTSSSWLKNTLVLVFATVATLGHAKKDRNQPHRHKGLLNPYQPNSFDAVSVTNKDENQLALGKSVTKQSIPRGKGADSGPQAGGALCIQDVNAPVEAVWYQILDFNNYKSKVPNIKTCQNYLVQEQGKTVNIKTRMILSALPGISFESFYDHTYFPDKSSLTWRLDYDKTSDFDDVAGHWHVESLGTTTTTDRNGNTVTSPKSRVFYACDIQMSGPVPTPLLNYIGKAALKKATAWVKRESEAHPDLKSKYTPQTTHNMAKAASSKSSRGGAIVTQDATTTAKNGGEKWRFAGFFKPKWAFRKN